MIAFPFKTLVFSLLYIMLHQLCFLYMLNYPVTYFMSEGESGSKHGVDCAYLSKIENSSYHQEFVSLPMPEHTEELGIQQLFPDRY